MTTWAVPIEGRDVWQGPDWAAPERLERWMFRPAPHPVLTVQDLCVVEALHAGQITPDQFQTAWKLRHG